MSRLVDVTEAPSRKLNEFIKMSEYEEIDVELVCIFIYFFLYIVRSFFLDGLLMEVHS